MNKLLLASLILLSAFLAPVTPSWAICKGAGGTPFNCTPDPNPQANDILLGGKTSNGDTVQFTIAQALAVAGSGVLSFNNRSGSVTLTSGDVTGALGYTPFGSVSPLPIASGGTGASTFAGASLPIYSGSFTLNDCIKIGATSPVTLTDAGAACGTGSGGGSIAIGTTTVTGCTSGFGLFNNSGLAGCQALSTAIDNAFGNTQGDILYRNASGWVVLPPGTSGNVLETGGAGANPSWGSVSGTGCVTSGSSILSGNGSGGCANITIGSNLNFFGGVLSATGPVTSVTNADSTLVVSPTTGAVTAKVATNGVAYANIQQVNADKLVGNPTASLANASEIALANGLCFASSAVGPCVPDSTKTANYTVAASDMAGQVNFNATSLTVTIPAISSTVFANGMGSLLSNQYTVGPLSVSTTPTINGCALTGAPYQIHSYGWWNLVSNGTSLDCIGFPGFDTITQNALSKFSDASGATTASAITDNGTVIVHNEPSGVAASKSVFKTIPNDGTTGTTQNKLAKLTSSGNAILAGTTDTNGEQGIVISSTSTAGNAQIAYQGVATCATDGTATSGHFAGISSSVAGDCTDVGTSPPLGSQTIGQFVTGGTGAGNYNISLAMGLTNTAGGGSGTVNLGTAGQLAYYATSTTAVSGNSNANISGGALTLGASGSAQGSLILDGSTSGATTIAAPTSGTQTATLPANTGTIAELNLAQTWSAAQALGSSTATTQSANDNSTKLATTAYVDRPVNFATPGSSHTFAGKADVFLCTTTCTVTPPVPSAGVEYCAANDVGVSTVITFAAVSTVLYGKTDQSAYGTVSTGTVVSGGATGDKLCIIGKDATHYNVVSFNGTWTNS